MQFDQMRRFVAQYATCGHCLFWKPESGDTHPWWAYCENNKTKNSVDEGFSEGCLSTIHDFGCIHWQVKAPTDIEAT